MDDECVSLPSPNLSGAPRKRLCDVYASVAGPSKPVGLSRFHELSDSDSDEGSQESSQFESKTTSNDSQPFLSQLLETNSEPLPSVVTRADRPFSSQQLPENKPVKKRTVAAKDPEAVLAKKLLKEQKQKEKSERAALQNQIKRLKPGECMKYITTIIGDGVLNYSWGKMAFERLEQEQDFKLRIGSTLVDDSSVTWEREGEVESQGTEEIGHYLLCWPLERVLEYMKNNTFLSLFEGYKSAFPTFRVYLAIYGLNSHLKTIRKKNAVDVSAIDNRIRRKGLNLSREEIQIELVEVEIKTGISIKNLNNPNDLVDLINQMTKIVAEIPYREMRGQTEEEMKWYAKGESKECIRVDKDFNGLRQLWVQQLCQFNMTSLDVAKSIAQVYPSPLLLTDAYNAIVSQKDKELLLQDIPIKKRQGAAGKKRVGPELSKKICTLFTQEDGNVVL